MTEPKSNEQYKTRDINDYLQYFRVDKAEEMIYVHHSFLDRLAELKGRALRQLFQIIFADSSDDIRELRKIQEAFEQNKSIVNRYNREWYKKQNIPENIRWAVWERDNFTCQHCGKRKYLTVDHVHPESKGGELTMDNLQTLCRSCNSRKGAK